MTVLMTLQLVGVAALSVGHLMAIVRRRVRSR